MIRRLSLLVAALPALFIALLGCPRGQGDAGIPASGTIRVAGAELHFVAEGRGTPVLVIGSSVYYPRLFSQGLRDGFRLIFLDLRHFVVADPDFDAATIGIETYLRDIEAAREALGLDRFALLGHSMHGAIALEYAARHPERVTRVIAVSAPPVSLSIMEDASNEYWETEASGTRKSYYEFSWSEVDEADLMRMSSSEAVVASYVAAGPMYWFDASFDATPLWEGVHFEIEAWNALMSHFATFDLDELTIRAPVLVVMGRYDFVVPHTLWENAGRGIDDLSFRLFERSGHAPPFEEPERFDALLREWFARPLP